MYMKKPNHKSKFDRNKNLRDQDEKWPIFAYKTCNTNQNKKFLDPYDLRDGVLLSDSYVVKLSDIKRNV